MFRLGEGVVPRVTLDSRFVLVLNQDPTMCTLLDNTVGDAIKLSFVPQKDPNLLSWIVHDETLLNNKIPSSFLQIRLLKTRNVLEVVLRSERSCQRAEQRKCEKWNRSHFVPIRYLL